MPRITKSRKKKPWPLQLTQTLQRHRCLNLNKSNAMLSKSLNRLSSGKQIVSPADDAGGLAVSMKLSAALKRGEGVNKNISNAISYTQTSRRSAIRSSQHFGQNE